MSYADFINFAHQLADASGEKLRGYFRNFGTIHTKDDKSPVTLADEETETILRAMIEKAYPEHGIIGEEHGRIREQSDYVWVLDPIDGTASFIIGRPIFGTLISLLYKGEPIVGVIDQPITRERWVAAKGEGITFNKKTVTVRKCSALSNAILCTTSPQYFTTEQKARFDNISALAKQTIYGGDCYNYALLASGQLDLVIEAGLKLHDFAALKVIIEEAGGTITDWEGNPLNASSNGNVIASASNALHQHVLRHL